MTPGELLDQLRGLNDALHERQRAGLTAREREECEQRIAGLRALLPTALLTHHDEMMRRGDFSVVAVSGTSCGGCHLKLPVSLLADLNQPGRIAVCPHCGVFVFKQNIATAHPPA